MFFSFEKQAADAKPCPFCGCNVIKATNREYFDEKNLHTVIVCCNDCGCQLQGNIYFDYEGAYESALEMWNRRAE